jgi:CheY-like chemotaxis protein
MSSERPTIVVRDDDEPFDRDVLAALASVFTVRSDVAPRPSSAGTPVPPSFALSPTVAGIPADAVLEMIAEGVGVWMPPGEDETDEDAGEGTDGDHASDAPRRRTDDLAGLVWSSPRLAARPRDVRRFFARTCRLAAEDFELAGGPGADLRRRPSRKYGFAADESHFECVISVLRTSDDGRIEAVAGLLWETTASQRLQSRIDAIDAAGAELLRIETESISTLDVRERLQRLEEKIVRSLNEVLHFDAFEVRLIDRETTQLELVINQGLSPLKIGEVIHVGERGNGICGYVAATGRPYLCQDASDDLLYQDGLDDARSSITVPLRLHDDSIIGVLNVESDRPEAFTEEDLRFAELFGRYIAMSMHILDLLVIERYTTNTRLAEIVRSELGGPLDDINARLTALMDAVEAPAAREEAERLAAVVANLRRRVEQGVTGPSSLIGAEQAMADASELDPLLVGRRILLADNEDVVRNAIRDLLVSHGCVVTDCGGGGDTIKCLEAIPGGGPTYDLVISDIRMPDRNGYEVFRAARAIDPTLPVLLMTGFGYDPHHSIVRASEEGLDGFLFKPLKAPQLLEAVRNAIPRTDAAGD